MNYEGLMILLGQFVTSAHPVALYFKAGIVSSIGYTFDYWLICISEEPAVIEEVPEYDPGNNLLWFVGKLNLLWWLPEDTFDNITFFGLPLCDSYSMYLCSLPIFYIGSYFGNMSGLSLGFFFGELASKSGVSDSICYYIFEYCGDIGYYLGGFLPLIPSYAFIENVLYPFLSYLDLDYYDSMVINLSEEYVFKPLEDYILAPVFTNIIYPVGKPVVDTTYYLTVTSANVTLEFVGKPLNNYILAPVFDNIIYPVGKPVVDTTYYLFGLSPDTTSFSKTPEIAEIVKPTLRKKIFSLIENYFSK